jgi:hypothetical protein
MVNGICSRMEHLLEVDVSSIEYPDPCDDIQNEDIIPQSNTHDLTNDYSVGIRILHKGLGKAYTRICDGMKKKMDIALPSKYMIDKQLPIKVVNDNNNHDGGVGDELACLSSFDGAEALRNNKDKTSVISFSSSIITKHLVQSKTSTASASKHIPTWLQVLGKEELPLLKKCTAVYFNMCQQTVIDLAPYKL